MKACEHEINMETGISGVGDMTARRRTTSSTEQGIKNRTDGEGAHLYIGYRI